MDQQSDFEPKASDAGQFETTSDCGLFGRALKTRVVWETDNNSRVRIDQIEVCLGVNHRGDEMWRDLAIMYLEAPHIFESLKRDPDLIYECELDQARAEAQYRAEGMRVV